MAFGNRGFRPNNSGMNSMDNNRFSPVKVGEELDVVIEASGEKGDGICKKKGFVLFVPNTKEGDRVKIRVTKVLRKVGFAEAIGEADEANMQQEEKPKKVVQPEPEIQYEDSEDFGEEPSEESDVEESSENDDPEEEEKR